MAAMSRGPAAKTRPPKKTKGGTASSRRHVFESFSQRIAKLKIEPVRRGRSAILDDAELDTTFSYFRDSLLEWRDLNISEVFTAFARQAAPLCESLPQVLHHSDRILELLVEYIGKGDKHSEEPLLSLMAHFAHDLGVRFEKHFEQAVRTVAHVAAKHHDVEVIEWAFTCLAWLFKYLSRLLVPDLRPLFDLMAPLLGKDHQKSFVTRFAAESLSFLVRKAGAAYSRDKMPLRLITRHISTHVEETQGSGKEYEFQHGLLALFVDSMKGVQRGLHSSAVAVLQELLAQTYHEDYANYRVPPLEPITVGAITAIIHHTDAENFAPLLDLLLVQSKDSASRTACFGLSSRILLFACGVRRGSRIAEWQPVLQSLEALSANVDGLDEASLHDFISLVATVFQYCPMDTAILHIQLIEALSSGTWEQYFLSFCNLFSDLGAERFKALLLPYLKRFISQRAHEHGTELCLVLPSLFRNGSILGSSIQPSARWQEIMVHPFEELSKSCHSDEDLDKISYECNIILRAMEILVPSSETRRKISKHLYDALQRAISKNDGTPPSKSDKLALGNGFQYLVQDSDLQEPLMNLWPSLCKVAGLYGHLLNYWESLLSLAEKDKTRLQLEPSAKEPFKQALMQCLGSPSHDMRLAALGILEVIAGRTEELHNVINTAMMIEQTPPNLENQRSIAMRIMKLAEEYPKTCNDEWVGEALPTFCFGLLHVRLTSVWKDACSALQSMCESTKDEGKDHVLRVAFEWLREPEVYSPFAGNMVEPEKRRYASEFECTNIMRLKDSFSKHLADSSGLSEQLSLAFEAHHTIMPFTNTFSRSQALRVLNALPKVAEQRARYLVPFLLDWALDQRVSDTPEDEDQDLSPMRWTRKDQKALLSLFSQFTNLKGLSRSADVYNAFLVLVGNGDVEMQKLALTGIVSWKEPAVSEYKENLFNLLDDARFHDLLTVFLSVDREESTIKEHHREQLLPVLLRLLYGRVISGKKGLEAKRKAVFVALTRYGDTTLHQFLSIALGPLNNISLLSNGELNEAEINKELISARKQVGLLNMLEDMLSILRNSFSALAPAIVEPLLYCLIRAVRSLSSSQTSPEDQSAGSQNVQVSMFKTIRQRALHSLTILFESYPEFAWDSFAQVIIQEVVNPRLQHFPIETAQSVSGLLRLFSAWSKSPFAAHFLVEYNSDVLSKIIDCLLVPSAKEEVKRFVLDDVIRNLIALVDATGETTTEARLSRNRTYSMVLSPYTDAILSRVGDLLQKSPGKDLLESGVHTVAELAPHVAGSLETRRMIDIATFLLRQPSKRVNAHTKLGLLKILLEFIPRCDSEDLKELFPVLFDSVCSLFSHSQDRTTRDILCSIVQELSEYETDLQIMAKLCQDLNAFSASRLDEPDFDRRLAAFNTINDERYTSFTITQWKPLIYNMLFYIKDNDELSIRINASLSLRRFIQASIGKESFKSLLSDAVLPSIQHGMREASELVRVEFLAVLSQLVHAYPDWPPIADLHVLLSAEEESSFFGNVLHIQGHRRLRALRRLASNAADLQGVNIYHFLIPLVEHFIFNKAEDESANNLAGESIRTISALSQWLEWPQFRSLLKRYIGYLASKEDMQKTVVKLLAGLMDGLNQAGRTKGYVVGYSVSTSVSFGDIACHEEDGGTMDVDKPKPTLSRTLPHQEKLTADVTNNILPSLTDFLHKKDESTVSLRVPIATAVTKVLLVLPQAEIEARLPAVLLDICHILKSRSQDGRDMSRNTLADITVITGPAYLGFILKALRTALQRGYQLHVLSFTLHYILVKLSEQMKPGDLDYCIPEIVDVIMDDIFGVTGQEKDAEDYISKMKEVKSSKSFDSLDIVARCATPKHLVDLVLPIKSLLLEKLHARMVQKIDELLRRIGLGVLQNPTVKDRDILIFCYELIQEVYKTQEASAETKKMDPRNKRYLVNLKGAAKSGARLTSSSYIYKITRFSLDILRTVLRKHEELQTRQNLAGFLPLMGDAMVQGQEEVQIAAIRLLTTIIRVPMEELDNDCPVYVAEAVRIIKGAPSSNTEIAQASLKMISAVLRERPNVVVKERDLAHLLKRILPDLDEPDRQGVTFGFLKSIMNRKIVMTEIYEVMDKVATMMVTNQTRSARDLARSNYFHFLMEYPQAKNRFTRQVEFLIRNLRYDYVEGRQSVMEALNLILNKVGDNILQDVLGMMFLPLIHSMANDDSSDCRTMAGALLKKLFERADSQRLKSVTSDLRSWLEQDEDAGLKRLGIQCWGLYLEAAEPKPKELVFVLGELRSTLEACMERRNDDDWELIYYSLTVYSKVSRASPDITLSAQQSSFWSVVQSCASYPHAWVKLTATKLMGSYFADLATTNGENGLGTLPLEGSRGLRLTEDAMIQLTNTFLRNMNTPNVTEELCAQSVRNLAFLARCLGANGATWDWQKVDDDDEVDEALVEQEDDSSQEEEWGGFSPPPMAARKQHAGHAPTAIHRLMTRLSGLLRRETKIMKASSLYPKSATMTLVETLCTKLPIDALNTAIPHLLTTLSTLADPATTVPRSTDSTFNDAYKGLVEKAREVMDVLQKRMGTPEYLKVIGEVQRGVKSRREERRQKRKIEAITMPEKHQKEKKRRHEVGKQRRKEKSAENKGRRRGW